MHSLVQKSLSLVSIAIRTLQFHIEYNNDRDDSRLRLKWSSPLEYQRHAQGARGELRPFFRQTRGGEVTAYVLVKCILEVVMRTKRSSNVSSMNSGSSLTSTLYFDIIIVMMAMLSVSENLKRITFEYFATSPMTKSARTVSRGTPGHLNRIHDARPRGMTEPNPPEPNGKNASLGHSPRNLSGRNVWGSFQYLAVTLR